MPEHLRAQLVSIVGASHVRGANELASLDPGIDPSNLAAGLAVRPANAAEVAAILRLCTAERAALVPQGGRTGLAGGAVSAAGQIVLLSDRLEGSTVIDPSERIATVSAGVTLQALQEAAAEHGLSPGIDIAARGSATIGGMISTNAGGMEAFRFGMMRERLLGIEGVLADGTIVSDLTRVTKANEGYDLKQLFCGTEGTLGIVTRATLRLERIDTLRQTALLAVSTADDAIAVMRRLQDRGTLLLAEIMWSRYAHVIANSLGLSAVLEFCDAPVYLLIDMAEEGDAVAEALSPLVEDGLVLDAVIAQNERERANIWRIREDTSAVDRAITHPLWFDISVPLTDLNRYMHALKQSLSAHDPANVLYAMGHLADGNLHLTVSRGRAYSPDERLAVTNAVEHGLKRIGGAISAEHGIGRDKLAALARNAPPGNLHAMRLLKRAFDPTGILNPGKVLETDLSTSLQQPEVTRINV